MNIYEAAIQAKENDMQMKRKCWRMAGVNVYMARWSNVTELRMSSYGRDWKPEPEDIMADDWEVVERQSDTEPQKPVPAPVVTQQPTKSRALRIVALATACCSLVISLLTLLLTR